MNANIFQVPASISKVTTMGDRSLRLQVDVERELSPEENGKVFSLYNTLGYFVFKNADIAEEDLIDLPEEKVEFKDQKSSSQILRNRLFVYYKDKFGKTDGFEDWRKKEMERIGKHYLDKIDN
jgi:hypothetical protein